MMKILAVTAALALSAATLSAHHSYAAFDREHPVTVEGTIGRVLFANPHVVLTLDTGGKTLSVEWGNLRQMDRSSVTTDTLRVGDRIVVTGAATRDPEDKRISLITDIKRPADGWHWWPGGSGVGF